MRIRKNYQLYVRIENTSKYSIINKRFIFLIFSVYGLRLNLDFADKTVNYELLAVDYCRRWTNYSMLCRVHRKCWNLIRLRRLGKAMC